MGRGATIGRWTAAVGALGVATLLAVTAIGHGDAGRPSAIQVATGSGAPTDASTDGAFHEVEPTRVVPGDGPAVTGDGSATGDVAGGANGTGTAPGAFAGPGAGGTTTSTTGSTLPGGATVTTPTLPGTGPLQTLLDPLFGAVTTTTAPGPNTTTTTTPLLLGIPLPIPAPSTPLPPLIPGL